MQHPKTLIEFLWEFPITLFIKTPTRLIISGTARDTNHTSSLFVFISCLLG